jgi:predicted transcriptional regulator YdeE
MVEREAFTVMGLTFRGRPSSLDYADIWCNQFGKVEERLRALSVDKAYYGLYCQTGEEGVVDMVAGMAVPPGEEPSAGLVKREVPSATYAVFGCTMGTIGQTWRAIGADWLPTSGYEWDPAGVCFECFPPDSEDKPDSPLSIFVPVVKRS